MTNDEVIAAIRALRLKITAWLNNEGEITPEEYGLFTDLTTWWQDKGIPMLESRRQEQIAKRMPKPEATEVDEVTLRFRWGGKDGKWRWMTETDFGFAQAGEERTLKQAIEAAGAVAEGVVE